MENPGFPELESERLVLRWMSPVFIEASLSGRIAVAELALAASVPTWWPDAEARSRLETRLEQMRNDPGSAEWLLRGIVRRADNRVVGVINFHGPPDDRNRAELGYTVFEDYRRQGYATEAALGMMRWASASKGVKTFVLCISPDNEPSLGMAARLGFAQVGSQMDEEDGLEWVFELDATDVRAAGELQ